MSYNPHATPPPPPPLPPTPAPVLNTAVPPPPPLHAANYYAYPPPPPSTYAPGEHLAKTPYYRAPPTTPPPSLTTPSSMHMKQLPRQPPPPADEGVAYNQMYKAPPPALPTPSDFANNPPPCAAYAAPSSYGNYREHSSYNYNYNYSGDYTEYGSNYTSNYGAASHTRYVHSRGGRQARYHGHYGGATEAKREDSYVPAKRFYREREREVASEHKETPRQNRETKPETERDRLLKSWRANFCETPEDMAKKLAQLSEADTNARKVWVRSSPADPFYRRTDTVNEVLATPRLEALCKLFEEELVQRAARVRASLPPYEPPPRKPQRRLCKHKLEACSSSSDSEHDGDDDFKVEQDYCMEELSRKLQHPYRVHSDLWHNDPGEMNDGPLCRCSAKSRRIGIRHGIYPGEKGYEKCQPNSNNATRLYHYTIQISPPTNFLTQTPTIIKHDETFQTYNLTCYFAVVFE